MPTCNHDQIGRQRRDGTDAMLCECRARVGPIHRDDGARCQIEHRNCRRHCLFDTLPSELLAYGGTLCIRRTLALLRPSGPLHRPLTARSVLMSRPGDDEIDLATGYYRFGKRPGETG
jgi:hypothetical protein